MKKLLALLLFASVAGGVRADAIDDYINAEMARQHVPGLALAIMRHGQLVRMQSYGFANLEHHVPVHPDTVFQSGALGKQFTAVAVMLLVEDGKLALDDSIRKYLPDAPPAWAPITIRQLLNHTSGLPTNPDGDIRREYTDDELLQGIYKQKPNFPAGTRWSYSNLGYLTLGILIHRVTGEFYGDFIQQRIFKPLNMSTARIISEADIIPNRSSGYRLENGHLKNQEWVSPTVNTTADGSLYFSILDLAKWDAALYSEALLKKPSLQQMWTVTKLRDGKPNSGHYGFGWFIESRNGHRVVEHEGQWQGFETQISRYPDDGLTVVVLTNLGSAKPQRIADAVAGIYLADKARGSSH